MPVAHLDEFETAAALENVMLAIQANRGLPRSVGPKLYASRTLHTETAAVVMLQRMMAPLKITRAIGDGVSIELEIDAEARKAYETVHFGAPGTAPRKREVTLKFKFPGKMIEAADALHRAGGVPDWLI
jgi:hypothetical protein